MNMLVKFDVFIIAELSLVLSAWEITIFQMITLIRDHHIYQNIVAKEEKIREINS